MSFRSSLRAVASVGRVLLALPTASDRLYQLVEQLHDTLKDANSIAGAIRRIADVNYNVLTDVNDNLLAISDYTRQSNRDAKDLANVLQTVAVNVATQTEELRQLRTVLEGLGNTHGSDTTFDDVRGRRTASFLGRLLGH